MSEVVGDVDIAFEVKSERDINPEDLNELDRLTHGEYELFKATLGQQPGCDFELGEAFWIHNRAKVMAHRSAEAMLPTVFIFARRLDEIVGYSISCLNASRVKASFLGVKRRYQRQGIGTRLLQERNNALLNLGITEYTTNAHPKVVRLFDHLGLRYTTTVLPGIDPGRKHVKVVIG